MNRFSTYTYEVLHELYPSLKSCAEFVASDNYLAKLQVKVIGKYASLAEYGQADKLYIAKELLGKLIGERRLFCRCRLISNFEII